jgi:hypothetical protein
MVNGEEKYNLTITNSQLPILNYRLPITDLPIPNFQQDQPYRK